LYLLTVITVMTGLSGQGRWLPRRRTLYKIDLENPLYWLQEFRALDAGRTREINLKHTPMEQDCSRNERSMDNKRRIRRGWKSFADCKQRIKRRRQEESIGRLN
jgi:hypothetical protein